MLTFPVVDVVQLAVQQVGFPDGADFDLVPDPLSATAGYVLLLQAVCQCQTFVLNLERLFVCFLGVKRLNKAWLAEQKLQSVNAVQLLT